MLYVCGIDAQASMEAAKLAEDSENGRRGGGERKVLGKLTHGRRSKETFIFSPPSPSDGFSDRGNFDLLSDPKNWLRPFSRLGSAEKKETPAKTLAFQFLSNLPPQFAEN